MTTNSFILVVQEGSVAPVPVRYDMFVQRLFKVETEKEMMLHAALGVCGEAGELADALKKRFVYGKPLDLQNLVEELGDLRFYMEAIMNHFGISDTEVLQSNANKLALRYKSLTYSDVAAITRADKAHQEETFHPLKGE